jgi:L-fucose mutarotase
MLKGQLIHPTILEVLGSSGHGSKILIADGNYPFSTGANPAARRVHLNLSPGKLTVTDVLEALISAVPIEAAEVMMTASGEEPSIYAEFRQLLPDLELQAHERFAFYEESKSSNVCLVVATGEQRIYANILLTIGTVLPEA